MFWKKMKDGTFAHITKSKRYYCRTEEDSEKITYYNLKGEKINLASGTCPNCKERIESLRCGHRVTCKCGKSYVDTDRWFPEAHRIGGLIAEQIVNSASQL